MSELEREIVDALGVCIAAGIDTLGNASPIAIVWPELHPTRANGRQRLHVKLHDGRIFDVVLISDGTGSPTSIGRVAADRRWAEDVARKFQVPVEDVLNCLATSEGTAWE